MRIIPRYHAELDFRKLSDEDRKTMASGIATLAPNSPLFVNSKAIQDSVAALAKKAEVLEQRNAAVDGDRVQLRCDIAEEAVARAAVDGELLTLVTLVEVAAQSPAEIQGMALTPRFTTRSKAPPEPPEGIDVHIPRRGHGRATVSAQQTDDKRRHYDAEFCLYGQDTWTRLVGNGKTRTLSFPTGTQVWVRFATVRGELQSEWCTPVLVTLP
jgi:hypothetical protein